jgi:hypothetical protein
MIAPVRASFRFDAAFRVSAPKGRDAPQRRGATASPELDRLVSVSAVKGACGVAARFAALTLDRRSSDQVRLVIG